MNRELTQQAVVSEMVAIVVKNESTLHRASSYSGVSTSSVWEQSSVLQKRIGMWQNIFSISVGEF